MDVDQDPSPLDLEHLLSSPSEGDTSQDELQDEVTDPDSFRTRLETLLAAVPEDDPLMKTMHCKPCLPRLGGKYKDRYRATPAHHLT